jgi:hypothetical protein
MPERQNSPENSKENLDRKLDHAAQKTLPTSGPVSVTITKGGAIDYDEKGVAVSGATEPSGRGDQGTGENLLDQAQDTPSSVAGSASKAARGANRGKQSVRGATDRSPEAERHHRKGSQAVWRQAVESPWLVLLGGVVIGYALAWMIYDDER